MSNVILGFVSSTASSSGMCSTGSTSSSSSNYPSLIESCDESVLRPYLLAVLGQADGFYFCEASRELLRCLIKSSFFSRSSVYSSFSHSASFCEASILFLYSLFLFYSKLILFCKELILLTPHLDLGTLNLADVKPAHDTFLYPLISVSIHPTSVGSALFLNKMTSCLSALISVFFSLNNFFYFLPSLPLDLSLNIHRSASSTNYHH